jgi:hypothetical protein
MLDPGSIVLYAVGVGAIVAIVAWMYWMSARLGAIERAVQSIEENTNSLREIVGLLRSVQGDTSLLGGIRGVFGSSDRKKSG